MQAQETDTQVRATATRAQATATLAKGHKPQSLRGKKRLHGQKQQALKHRYKYGIE